MGRLKYAYKIVLIPALVLLPLGWVLTAYVGVQNGQTAFSAKERGGVTYLTPLAALATATSAARHTAVTGGTPASLAGGISAVDAVDARLGAELETTETWGTAKSALARVGQARTPREAYEAYNAAEDAVVTLIVKVSDGSNLTLDPDLDTYYAMDALMFRLPPLLQAAGRTVDETILAKGGDPQVVQDTRINLALNGGTLSTMRASVSAGMATAYLKTADGDLKPRPADAATKLDDAIGALLDQVTAVVKSVAARRVPDGGFLPVDHQAAARRGGRAARPRGRRRPRSWPARPPNCT